MILDSVWSLENLVESKFGKVTFFFLVFGLEKIIKKKYRGKLGRKIVRNK